MRFAFIEAWKEVWSVEFLCRIMQVTSRGFRAWRVRPMSQRQRTDMVLLAHIREQHRLSLQSYGRELLSNLVFEDCWSCGDLVWVCGFNSVFERDASDDFGEIVKAA